MVKCGRWDPPVDGRFGSVIAEFDRLAHVHQTCDARTDRVTALASAVPHDSPVNVVEEKPFPVGRGVMVTGCHPGLPEAQGIEPVFFGRGTGVIVKLQTIGRMKTTTLEPALLGWWSVHGQGNFSIKEGNCRGLTQQDGARRLN